MSLERVPKAPGSLRVSSPSLLVAGAVVLLAGGSSSSGEDAQFTGAGHPGVDLANTRQASGADRQLQRRRSWKTAWKLPLTAQGAYGSYASTPIIAKGVDLLPGPRIQRAGDRPRQRRGAVDEEVPTNRRATAPTASSSPTAMVFGATADGSLRARPGNRQGGLVGDADPQRQREHRHGARRTTTAWSTSRPCR